MITSIKPTGELRYIDRILYTLRLLKTMCVYNVMCSEILRWSLNVTSVAIFM